MRRAELMGPPGVGKTTILQAARGARNAVQPEFMSYGDLALPAAVMEWLPFEAFVHRAYADAEGVAARRKRATLRALKKARRIEADPGAGLVLKDENLCQRGLSLALTMGADAAAEYFGMMPVPAVVFMVSADPAMIESRNVARAADGTGVDRSALVQDAHAACIAAASQLRARGVEMVEIDAAQSIADSVAMIMDTARRLA